MGISTEEAGLFFTFCMKVLLVFLSFVGGVVTTTWAVATKIQVLYDKVLGLDVRMAAVEKQQSEENRKIQTSLTRLHERIDVVLLSRKK